MESKSAITQRSTASADVEPNDPRTVPRPHLAHLDGLRGLAALYVVLHHAVKLLELPATPHWMARLSSVCGYGHFAVNTFIVLSGYCLMLPFITSRNSSLRSEVIPFIRRRAVRILPPYYAALLISLLLLPIINSVAHGRPSMLTDNSWPSSASIISHLLLLHNLDVGWISQINGPLWSVATEWQIYFIFILLLLPTFRKIGVFATVVAGFAIGLLPHFLAHDRLDTACFWFLGSFALGMMGAYINFATTSTAKTLSRLPWGIVCVATLVAVKLVLARHAPWLADPHYGWIVIDPLFGLATMGLLIASTNSVLSGKSARILTIFTNRPTVALGVFSYSLYLIHAPVLYLAYALLQSATASATVCIFVMCLGVVPLCVGVAYLFHVALERPFLRSHKKKVADMKSIRLASVAMTGSAVKAEEVLR